MATFFIMYRMPTTAPSKTADSATLLLCLCYAFFLCHVLFRFSRSERAAGVLIMGRIWAVYGHYSSVSVVFVQQRCCERDNIVHYSCVFCSEFVVIPFGAGGFRCLLFFMGSDMSEKAENLRCICATFALCACVVCICSRNTYYAYQRLQVCVYSSQFRGFVFVHLSRACRVIVAVRRRRTYTVRFLGLVFLAMPPLFAVHLLSFFCVTFCFVSAGQNVQQVC